MIEYFNLFINKDIKDSDEMKALIELVKKKQEESGKKQPMFINQKDKGPYATVKLVGKEEDASPF